MSCWQLCTITDKNGLNPVNLHEANGPVPIPLPVAGYDVQISQMRVGAAGPGYRAVQLIGAIEANSDWEITCENITPQQLAALQVKYFRQPAEPIRLTNDGGVTWYSCVFAANGLQPRNNDWTPDRIAVTIRLHTLRRLP